MAHFSMKMLIFHCFYKVLTTRARAVRSLVFLAFLMTFAAECANVRADGPDYCESFDMESLGRTVAGWRGAGRVHK